MIVQTKSFATLVGDASTAAQANSAQLVDFSQGSILLAAVEAAASQGLWLESIALQILAVTRASTSVGPDLDSFVADFGLTREGAVASAVSVTFARFTPAAQAVVPLGAQVQTADGTQTFTVIKDITNPHWNTGLNGYVLAIATASISVPVAAALAGSGGNVLANTINLILNSIPGVDTVNNPLAASGGIDPESDAALRIRFQAFLQSLASATPAAIRYAVSSVQAGLTDTITENLNPDNSIHLGWFFVVVDDGTGSPPGSLLSAVYAAIDLVRACGVSFAVFGPMKIVANIAANLTLAAGYDRPTVDAAVNAAWTAYINSLALGESLAYTRLAQVAYDASPGITNVVGLTINGGVADLAATSVQVIRAGTTAAN